VTHKIQSLQIQCVNLPLPQPHATASGVISASPLVVLTVNVDGAEAGNSITFTYTVAALKAVADVMSHLEPLVKGKALDPAAISRQLQARFRLVGTHGLIGMALAGLDMALWDALARTQQKPLYVLLGGMPRPLSAYGPVGYDGARGSALAAEQWARRGFKAVKAKIGYPTVEDDVAVIRSMQHATGGELRILVDYNQSLDPAEAARRLPVLDELGLEWIEEPVIAHDFISLARLSAMTRTPLQAGENWWSPVEFRHALSLGANDLLMPDVMKCGGVTGWMEIAAMAKHENVAVSSHLWPEISTQLLYATETAGQEGSWLEYCDWWNPILEEPLRMVKGNPDGQDVIGTGVKLNLAAVDRYRV
jgi:mandelate racemase